MTRCTNCERQTADCQCDVASNDNAPFSPELIELPSNELIARQSAVHRLAIAYRAKSLPRRAILNHLTDVFSSCEGEVHNPGSHPFPISDIDVDEVFRTDDDPSERWLSDFLRAGVMCPQREAQNRVLPRLKVLWLALAITNPNQARSVLL